MFFYGPHNVLELLCTIKPFRCPYMRRDSRMIPLKKKYVFILILFSWFTMITILSAQRYDKYDVFSRTNLFVLFDFDQRNKNNSIGGESGTFENNVYNTQSYCRFSFKRDRDLNYTSYYMALDYDVASSLPTFNGWYTKLNGIDLSSFEAISLTIKGDPNTGFSKIFKIELKDSYTSILTLVEGISNEWKTIVIPFHKFIKESDEKIDFKQMQELVFVFEDWRLKKKIGRYFIDNILFIPKKGKNIKFKDIMKN